MPLFQTTLIGLPVYVRYIYEAADVGSNFEPSHRESVSIEWIDIDIECDANCPDVRIDPNELHASQLEDLEKEAMMHYKDRA